MNSKWMQLVIINDPECAKRLKDIDGPLFNVKIDRDPQRLSEFSKSTESEVYAIMELSVPDKFTEEIVTNFLKDLSKHIIYETMGIKPENQFEIKG